MDTPGAFATVLVAYDELENGTSVEAVERTLAELICIYPDHEIVEQLRWKLTDLIVDEMGFERAERALDRLRKASEHQD